MIGPLPSGIVQGLFPQNQMQTVAEPFVYGPGGRRMTPDQIARERQIVENLTQSDYSPVGHWTQGLGRVFDNVSGKLRERKLDRAEAGNQAYSQNQIARLLSNPGGTPSASGPPGVGSQSSAPGGSQTALMSLLADPYTDDGVKAVAQMQLKQQQQMAMKQFEIDNRAPPQPTEFERLVSASGMTPEQQTAAIRKYVENKTTDPIDWIRADNGDGTFTLVPMGPNGPINQQGQAAMPRPKGKLTPYNGGQPASPAGTFR